MDTNIILILSTANKLLLMDICRVGDTNGSFLSQRLNLFIKVGKVISFV